MSTRTTRIVLTGLMVLAAGLRFATLGNESFWFDESITAAIASRSSLWDVLDSVSFEATPPLYYVLLWFWGNIFGTGDVALRALPALLGTATVPVAYAAGARLSSPRVGLIAAALTATSPLLIHYSQENRPYSLLALLGALSLYFFLGAREDPSGRRLVAWAVTSALALGAHYFALFLVVPEAVWLLVRLRASGRLHSDRRLAALVFGSLLALGAVLLSLALHQRSNAIAWIAETPLDIRLRETGHYFLKGVIHAPGAGFGLVSALVVLAAVGLLLTRADREERSAAAIPLALAASALLLVLVTAADVLLYRNLIALWLPLALVVACGLGARRAGPAGLALGAVLAGVWIAIEVGMVANDRYHRHDWESAAEMLGEPSASRAVVVIPSFSGTALRRYAPRLIPGYHDRLRTSEFAFVGEFQPAAAARTVPGLPSFRLVEVTRVDPKLSIARYLSPHPVEVSAKTVALFRGGLLLQPPRPR